MPSLILINAQLNVQMNWCWKRISRPSNLTVSQLREFRVTFSKRRMKNYAVTPTIMNTELLFLVHGQYRPTLSNLIREVTIPVSLS